MSSVSPSILIGFRTLRVNPLRTVLSTLGVIIGVAALVAVLALGDGMEQHMRDEILASGSVQQVVIEPVTTRELDGIALPDSTAPSLSPHDAAALAGLPGVALASMYVAAPTSVAAPGVREHAAIARGGLASLARRDSLVLAHGRFYTDHEVLADAAVGVLSHDLATALAGARGPAALVGTTVQLPGHPATIVGVLAPPPGPARAGPASRSRPTVHVPVGFAERIMVPSPTRRANVVLIASSVEQVRPVRDQVARWIAAERPQWGRQVAVRINADRADKAQQGILLFKLFMGAMTGISLVVGGIGIMNVLLASVVERTREIGIRKATGARQRDILVQFLSESVAISGMGSGIGLALGFIGAVAVTAVMREMTQAPVRAGFSLSTFLVAATAAVFVGLVFGTYPALRAARLSPVEAMHTE